MNKTLKSILSCILALMMISGTCSAAFAAVPMTGKRETTIPTVYIAGYGSAIYKDKNDKNSGSVYSSDILSDATFNKLKAGFKEPLMYGIKTDDWGPYCDFIVETCEKDLSAFRLDDNGNASNGTGNDCIQDKNPKNRMNKGGKHNLFSYQFIYDWRLDPFTVASQLNDYIKNVKKATGAEKVNLVGRCLGGNMVMTYLHEYGYDDVNAVEFYIGLFDGADIVGAMFSGKIKTDPAAMQKYINKKMPDSASGEKQFLKNTLEFMAAFNMMNLPVDLVYKVYENVYENIIPRLMKVSYGTLPAFWSFVGNRYFEDAKKLIFTGEEEKYAELIAKIDRYHYEIFNHTTDIVKEGMRQGVNFYNFVKYGSAMAPICEEAKLCNDNTTTVRSQTFGSVSSEVSAPFSTLYIKNAHKNGNAKYISADCYIDASKDMLRDHTWFIKGPDHKVMPESVNILMANVFEANGKREASDYITTDHFEGYPRFLLASANSTKAELTPLTGDNDGESNSTFSKIMQFFNRIKAFFNKVIEMIKHMFGM